MNDPGTKLKGLLAQMGIHPTPDCPCHEHMMLMDEWGVQGCREHRAEIVNWLRDGCRQWGWGAVISHAAKGLMTGLAFSLKPWDPTGSLVDLAIREAEKEAAEEYLRKVLRQGSGLVG